MIGTASRSATPNGGDGRGAFYLGQSHAVDGRNAVIGRATSLMQDIRRAERAKTAWSDALAFCKLMRCKPNGKCRIKISMPGPQTTECLAATLAINNQG